MPTVFVHAAGNTLGVHEKITAKLRRKGVSLSSKDDADVIIVFCPIASRFETDINAALADFTDRERVILVAMHFTQSKNYILPDERTVNVPDSRVLVHCLFDQKRGLYKCSCNRKAKKLIYRELNLPSKQRWFRRRSGDGNLQRP